MLEAELPAAHIRYASLSALQCCENDDVHDADDIRLQDLVRQANTAVLRHVSATMVISMADFYLIGDHWPRTDTDVAASRRSTSHYRICVLAQSQCA